MNKADTSNDLKVHQETSIDPINKDAGWACRVPCPPVKGYDFTNWYKTRGRGCQDSDIKEFLEEEIREENFEL